MKKIKNLQKHERLPFWGKVHAERFYFENGLRLIVVENKLAPVFTYQTWYNVGSRDETPGYTGLAHLFEHMMFKGTKSLKPGEFDKIMESHGARDLNAFTSTDYTVYVQSLPVQYLPLVAKLEAERMTNLVVNKIKFESEREVVHNERRSRTENSPEGRMYEELQKLAFTKHPYGWPVIGFAEDLNRMTAEDCRKFYRTFYAPNNATIVIVGDVSGTEAALQISKYYGKISASNTQRIRPQPEPDQKQERIAKLPLNVQLEKAFMGYKIPEATSQDFIPLYVLSALLSAGRSSRLYQALVDKSITMNIDTGPSTAKDPTLFWFGFTSQQNRLAEDAIQAIDREIKNISNTISEDEVNRAKNKLQTDFFVGLGSNSAKAHFIGEGETVFGDFCQALQHREQIQKITKNDLICVAEKYLQEKHRNILIGVPV